jgi:F-type H+-transporting ATPase subunit a
VLWKLPEISAPPETLFFIGPLPITNSLLLSIISGAVVITFFLLAARHPRLIPRPLQNLIEWMTQGLLNICEEVAGRENGRRFFKWVAAIFFLVLIANWWSVIPGIGTIGIKNAEIPGCEGVNEINTIFLTGQYSNCYTPLLRPPSTDLNFTLALALITVIMTQVYGFRILGVGKQLGRYFTLKDGPIGLVVGLLELLLEPLRVISLSFRLFGNVFAGEVLLIVIGFLLPVLGPIPFYFLEIFVGFIQAYVFAFLALMYFTLGTTPHGHEDHQEEHAAEVEAEAQGQAERALSQR